jgi:hypothetical protein
VKQLFVLKCTIIRGISCTISCSICCKSQVQFAANRRCDFMSAVEVIADTKSQQRFACKSHMKSHRKDFVCDFMCNLLHIASAIYCICDLVSVTELLPITRTMQFCVQFAVRFGACDLVHVQFLRNCKTNTESHTKSYLRFGSKKDRKYVILVGHRIVDTPNCICNIQQIAHEIAHEIARVISPLLSQRPIYLCSMPI